MRFGRLCSGAGNGWHSHTQLEPEHSKLCRSVAKPIASLATGFRARGLLT